MFCKKGTVGVTGCVVLVNPSLTAIIMSATVSSACELAEADPNLFLSVPETGDEHDGYQEGSIVIGL